MQQDINVSRRRLPIISMSIGVAILGWVLQQLEHVDWVREEVLQSTSMPSDQLGLIEGESSEAALLLCLEGHVTAQPWQRTPMCDRSCQELE